MTDPHARVNRVRWFWLARHFGVWRTVRWFFSPEFRRGWHGEEDAIWDNTLMDGLEDD